MSEKLIAQIKQLPDQTLKGVVLPDDKVAELKALVIDYERLRAENAILERSNDQIIAVPQPWDGLGGLSEARDIASQAKLELEKLRGQE